MTDLLSPCCRVDVIESVDTGPFCANCCQDVKLEKCIKPPEPEPQEDRVANANQPEPIEFASEEYEPGGEG